MKLEDLAYAIAQKVFWELEHTHHFVVPENIRKDILAAIRAQLNSLIK
ncbi:MAG: hypothetical protein KBC05_00620 [Candidatus Hydrogenedentes bacterium]|nr:hypothetical protein [Candidatus Hydrogenedentota bacterium]